VPIAFLIDEQLRDWLYDVLIRTALRRGKSITVVDVGDESAPPLGTPDPHLLDWCEQNGHVLVTLDKRTMPDHFRSHLTAGKHSHGVFIVKPDTSLSSAIEFLLYAAEESSNKEWVDSIIYI
jgi:hypothetical protein